MHSAPSPSEVSEAIVVWTGWGRESWPKRDEARLVERFGEERARELLPTIRRLESQFYRSDAKFTVAELGAMGDRAASQFRDSHPELTSAAVEALAWCYTYDYK